MGLFIDGFAGGGGASTGIAQAIGRDVDIAINHSPTAIAIHKANHPTTEHHCQDIRAVWPANATRLRPVDGAWFSPDCKEYSKAKGGPVKDRHIRALANEVTVWLRETRPAVAYLENVEEFEYAAPLDEHGIPIKGLEGKAFKSLVRQWRGLGFRVQWRVLKACDYGAPTSRKRLYVIMRSDGLPIVWPKATHAPANDNRVLSGKLLPYRTAAECIDWSIPCPSIFDRPKDLADATNRRVAHGVVRHVINAAKQGKAFIVPVTHQGSVRVHDLNDPMRTVTGAHRGELALSAVHMEKFSENSRGRSANDPLDTVMAGAARHSVVESKLAPFITYGQHGGANRSADEPHHTIAASKKDQNCIAAVTMVQTGYGERKGQAPRALDPHKPLGTIVGGGGKHAAVSAFMTRFYGSDTTNAGGDPEQPLGTARAGGQHHAVVCAHMEQANGGPRNTNAAGHPVSRPLSTTTTTGSQQRLVETTLVEEGALPPEMMKRATMVAAFLIKYYGDGGQSQAANAPLDVVTTKARYAVVTVTIDAVTYIIVDIGLRMLKPRELARAQGFPDTYILDPIVRKFLRGKWVERRLTIAEQISAIGNSVCPPVARALVAANQPRHVEERLAA